MGYLLARKDSTWDVAHLELPSSAVGIYQYDDPLPATIRRPSNRWREGPVDVMGENNLWARTLDTKPCYGISLSEFYREFFLDAFKELMGVLRRA